MKKILPMLVILLALGAAGAAVYLFQKQGRGDIRTDGVDTILPLGTQLLLSMPDLEGTISNWESTDLYKIWSEPEVRDFLAKPLSKLPPHKDLDETVSKIMHLSPTRVFVALTTVDQKTNDPHAIAGFDFKGDRAEVEQLLESVKESIRKKSPAGKADLIAYQGHSLETFESGDGSLLASTYLDHRYLVSNDLTLLKATIDRCDHRTPAPDGDVLAKDSDYQTVLAKLPARHETLIFVRPQSFLRRLLDLSATAGQSVDESRRAELDRIKAIGATTCIENGKLRDTFYYLAPGMSHDLAKLQMSALPLTSQSTLLFAAYIFDLPARFALPEGPLPPGTPASGLLTGLQELAAMLGDHGLTLDRFRAAFGHEFSLNLDWPPDRAQPALIVTVDVHDRVAAGKFVDDLTSTLIAEAAWQVTQTNGLTFHTLTAANVSYVSPTITLTDKHLVFGLNPSEVREAAQREQTGGPNFTGGESYKNTVAMVAAPDTAFIYADTPALFERAYGLVRGFPLFGAMLVYPQIGEYIDPTKLPGSQTISKHLSPTVFSQRIDEQGGLLDSVGSVTVGQAAFTLLGGAGAAAIPFAQSQMGGATTPALPVVPGRVSPAPAKPAASADSTPPQPDGGQ